ncbi:MAG: hypothetical protein WC023_01430 [Rhodocyclaceae bacterium]
MAHIIADMVKETSTTTGTGALTVAGALTGHRALSSVLAVGDTCFYTARGVDATEAPTGEWECGLGTYSGANTLTRTTVLSSSNAGAAVSFSAGTKQVFISMPAAQVAWARERLTADRTYYVRTDGSDTNTGLANTSGGAFLTIQKAVNTICNTLSLAGFTVTVQIADGTYTGATLLKPLPDNGAVTIQGNSGTPANVLISTTSADCFKASGAGASYTIKDLKVQTTTSGDCIFGTLQAEVQISNVVFGACAAYHTEADYGALVTAIGNYSIAGAAQVHWLAWKGGVINVPSKTVTITGTPAFSAGFAYAERLGMIISAGTTYSGSATGVRYTVTLNAIIHSGTALPGSSAGTAATGGQYL